MISYYDSSEEDCLGFNGSGFNKLYRQLLNKSGTPETRLIANRLARSRHTVGRRIIRLTKQLRCEPIRSTIFNSLSLKIMMLTKEYKKLYE